LHWQGEEEGGASAPLTRRAIELSLRLWSRTSGHIHNPSLQPPKDRRAGKLEHSARRACARCHKETDLRSKIPARHGGQAFQNLSRRWLRVQAQVVHQNRSCNTRARSRSSDRDAGDVQANGESLETDDNYAAAERGGRLGAGGHEPEVTTDGTETEEEGSGNEEASAPSELARSLGEHSQHCSGSDAGPSQAPRPRRR
jgi:hypothetical protein